MAAPRKVTSFKSATKEVKSAINGTKLSTQNFSLLVSSGINALDTLLGGGLPVGSLLIIEEDECGYYSGIIAKCFISEGILCKQRCFIASKDVNVRELVNNLPGQSSNDLTEDRKISGDNKVEMQIAWRYQNLKVADATITGNIDFGHKLDLTKNLPKDSITDDDIYLWPSKGNQEDFLPELLQCLNEDKHRIDGKDEGKQVMRLAALRLGSPLWPASKIAAILYNLRSWLRRSVAVGLVTIPSRLFQDKSYMSRWMHFADMCIQLDSFAGTANANHPALKDYHGLLHIKKLATFNSLAPHQPLTDLAFKLRRRKLVIERFCLPPELEDTSARGNENSNLSCASAKSKNLDF